MSEERKASEAPPLEQDRAASGEGETEELGNEDLEQLARAAREAILQNRTERRPDAEAPVEEPAGQAEPQPGPGLEQRLAEAERALAQRDEEIAALKDRTLRLAAEFDNFKKRSRKERQDLVQYANEELIKQLLPVLDNFQRALENGRQQGVPEAFYKGLELIYSQAAGTLERIGVKPLEAVGKPFDPNLHEAVMQDPNAELPENFVVQEFRRGYSLNDKIIRQAMVSVSSRAGGSPARTDPDQAPAENAQDLREQPPEPSAESTPSEGEPNVPDGGA